MRYSDKLQYFNNKFCTIFTPAINRDYRTESPSHYPKQLIEYFSGFVESIDESGIMLKSINKTKSYFFLDAIISIAEEQVLNENDNKEEIEEIKKAKEQPILNQESSPFLDTDKLMEFSKKIKSHI